MSSIKYIQKYLVLGLALLSTGTAWAQEPHFTQYASAPFIINPAFTGVFNGKMRVMANLRQQWSSLGSPYSTSLLAMDAKLFDEEGYAQNPFNMGVQFVTDRSMKGAFQTNFITATSSYHVALNFKGDQTLGLGMSIGYGNRKIDFSSLSTESQFTDAGFDLTLPNGELGLGSVKPYLTTGAGLLYCYNNENEGTFFDFGVSAFNLNQPLQTFLYDSKEVVPLRMAAQASLQKYMYGNLLLNVKMLYQSQANTDYLVSGFSMARLMEEDDVEADMIGVGLWYRTGDAIAPMVFGEFNQFKVGLSYDIQINGLRKNTMPANSMELSLQWRMLKNKN
jgi:type IX secretion system PorP/SprF family membrane protein